MKWSSVSLSVLGCFLFTLTAWAGEDKQPPPREQEKEKPAATSQPAKESAKGFDLDAFIKRFDHNGDGCLERNELPATLRVRFGDWDTDKDGKLSRDELAKHEEVLKHWEAMAVRRQDRLILLGGFLSNLANTDDPGREIVQGVYGVLQMMDTNHDGKIDKEEWEEGLQQLRERRVDALLERQGSTDGKLKKDQCFGRVYRNFDKWDLNHDGVLDRDELMQAFGGSSKPHDSKKKTESKVKE